jgi:lipoprotein-releasing system permease protein
MNISTLIARRYLFAKKSRNVINLISFISFFGLFVSSAALIIILSGFNGIQQYVEQMYGKHSASIYIQPIKGKIIKEHHPIFDSIKKIDNIKYFSKIIEETALLKFKDKWTSVVIKGLDSSIYTAEKWSESIIDGDPALYFRGYPTIILGYGIQNQLQAPIDLNFLNEIKVFNLSRNKKLSVQNKGSLKTKNLIFGGVFSINPELDQTYAIVDYNVADDIFEMNNSAHSIELFLENPSNLSTVKNSLKPFNKEFKIRSHEEKNQLIYAANDAEKWMVLAVLIFILILSSFTIIASITMLIIDKKKDIKTLKALGCKYSSIKNIFFKEGLFISLLGSISGLLIGVIICWLQVNFQLIKLENAAINYWPVKVELSDVIMLMAILFSCGLIAAYLPSKILMRKLISV